MTKIEIPLSKTKNILMVLGAFIFVYFGTLFILTPSSFESIMCRSALKIRIAGVASVLFFGSATIYGIIKFFDSKIGLAITDTGIIDNTKASSVGLINWSDVTKITIKQVKTTKFLLVFIKDSQKYLLRVGPFKRKLLQASIKMYGTPLSITSNTLKYNFTDLEKLLQQELDIYRNTMNCDLKEIQS